jgi:hypothetical protein
MREEKSKSSILSGFSFKRMAAITDKSFRDCNSKIIDEFKYKLVIHFLNSINKSPLQITAERASFVIALISSFPVQTLGMESLS